VAGTNPPVPPSPPSSSSLLLYHNIIIKATAIGDQDECVGDQGPEGGAIDRGVLWYAGGEDEEGYLAVPILEGHT